MRAGRPVVEHDSGHHDASVLLWLPTLDVGRSQSKGLSDILVMLLEGLESWRGLEHEIAKYGYM